MEGIDVLENLEFLCIGCMLSDGASFELNTLSVKTHQPQAQYVMREYALLIF